MKLTAHGLILSITILLSINLGAGERVASLDYCADQFVLRLVDRANVVALSPDATREFSYLRDQASGYPTARPNAESILALAPDTIVRSYGGGANAPAFYNRLNINVVQVGFANSVADIRAEVLRLSRELGNTEEGELIARNMDARLAGAKAVRNLNTMYVTAGGVVAGKNTLMNDMIKTAGHTNFEKRAGWRSIPLETLTLNQPEQIAAAFYGNGEDHRNYWSAARHPIIRDQLKAIHTVVLDGATTACGGWFLMDAIEQLAANEN